MSSIDESTRIMYAVRGRRSVRNGQLSPAAAVWIGKDDRFAVELDEAGCVGARHRGRKDDGDVGRRTLPRAAAVESRHAERACRSNAIAFLVPVLCVVVRRRHDDTPVTVEGQLGRRLELDHASEARGNRVARSLCAGLEWVGISRRYGTLGYDFQTNAHGIAATRAGKLDARPAPQAANVDWRAVQEEQARLGREDLRLVVVAEVLGDEPRSLYSKAEAVRRSEARTILAANSGVDVNDVLPSRL
jgi:hypothetical protein